MFNKIINIICNIIAMYLQSRHILMTKEEKTLSNLGVSTAKYHQILHFCDKCLKAEILALKLVRAANIALNSL